MKLYKEAKHEIKEGTAREINEHPKMKNEANFKDVKELCKQKYGVQTLKGKLY